MSIVAIIIAVIVIKYAISKRNEFEELRHMVKVQLSDISISEEKHDKTMNELLHTAAISHRNEVDGIETLSSGQKLEQLRYLGQRYPELMSTAGYSQILSQVSYLQEEIASSRSLLNSNINAYNIAITSFPGLIVAAIFGYKRESLIDEEHLDNNKKLERKPVDFSKF